VAGLGRWRDRGADPAGCDFRRPSRATAEQSPPLDDASAPKLAHAYPGIPHLGRRDGNGCTTVVRVR